MILDNFEIKEKIVKGHNEEQNLLHIPQVIGCWFQNVAVFI
jgi:hypothetical protein